MRFLAGDDDVPICVAYTHACAASIEPVVEIETERAQIRYVSGRHVEVRVGTNVEVLRLSPNPHHLMLRSFRGALHHATSNNGDGEALVASTLEMARAHIVAVNAASEAAPVIDVAPDCIQVVPSADQSNIQAIRDVVPVMKSLMARRCLLHDSRLASWSHPAGRMTINGYSHFAGPASSSGAAPPAATNPASIAATAAAAH
jgi:hypothetical protein